MNNITQDVTARLVIDPVTRTISPKYRNAKSVYVAKGDHNSVVIAFEMPRYVDGNDMSNSTIQIHFVNIDKKTKAKSMGISDAVGIKTETDDITGDEIVVFGWRIPNTATRHAGVVSVGVTFERYENVDGETEESYSWSTAPFGKTFVHESMDFGSEVAEKEFNQLVSTCNAIIEEAIKREFTDEIKNAVDEVKQSGDFKPQKGVDYWTEEDKNELVNDVLKALPRAEGVEF